MPKTRYVFSVPVLIYTPLIIDGTHTIAIQAGSRNIYVKI